jgi:hypothetical protein
MLLPFDRESLIKYRATGLDEKFRWDVHLEPEAPLACIDFIDPAILGERVNSVNGMRASGCNNVAHLHIVTQLISSSFFFFLFYRSNAGRCGTSFK